MKKILLLLTLTTAITSFSQQKVEDVFRVKAGLVGFWVGYEKAISSDITLNGEVGYEGMIYPNQNSHSFSPRYLLTSTLSIEGKYYLNLNKRALKEKNTENNAADFLSLEFVYVPDFGTVGDTWRLPDRNVLNIMTAYGFARNLSSHFQFEFKGGFGYQFAKNDNGGLFPVLETRIGYAF